MQNLLTRWAHWLYLLIVRQDFLYNVHIHVTNTVVEATNTKISKKTNNCKHLGSHMEGIIYSMQYSLVQLVAGDVLLYICLRKKRFIMWTWSNSCTDITHCIFPQCECDQPESRLWWPALQFCSLPGWNLPAERLWQKQTVIVMKMTFIMNVLWCNPHGPSTVYWCHSIIPQTVCL